MEGQGKSEGKSKGKHGDSDSKDYDELEKNKVLYVPVEKVIQHKKRTDEMRGWMSLRVSQTLSGLLPQDLRRLKDQRYICRYAGNI